MKVDDCMEWVKNVSSHHSQWQNMKAEVWKLRLDRLNKLAKIQHTFDQLKWITS